MPYIGKQPTKIPLTSDDIADGAISSADIADLDATKLTGTVNNARISLDAAEIPNLDAAKITSGDIALARLGNAPATDLTPVKNDISLLALQNAINGNLSAYGLKNSWIEQFENSTYIENLSTTARNSSEYMSSMGSALGAFTDDSDTGFLLHSNTTNLSTTFTDSSSHGKTISAQGTSPIHSTAQSKIGSSSILLSGSNGLTVANHASHVFAGDFTMEYWIHTPAGGSGSRVVVLETGSADQIYTRHRSDSGSYGLAQVLMTGEANSAGEAYYSHNLAPEQSAIGAWVHIALVRQGAVIRGYIGGVQKVTWTKAAINETPNGQISIGYCNSCGPGEYLQASSYLDEIRISGVCRYPDGTTFTPNEVASLSATGSFDSTDIAPSDGAAKTSIGLVILYKDAGSGSCVLNADVIARVRANTGQAYSENVLVLAGIDGTTTPSATYSDGLKVAIAPAVTVTSGTALSYQISFANQSASKEARIYGVAMTY